MKLYFFSRQCYLQEKLSRDKANSLISQKTHKNFHLLVTGGKQNINLSTYSIPITESQYYSNKDILSLKEEILLILLSIFYSPPIFDNLLQQTAASDKPRLV